VSSKSRSDPVSGARYSAESTAAAPTIAYAGDPAIVSRELRSPPGPPRPRREVTGSRNTLAAARDGPAAVRKAVKQPFSGEGQRAAAAWVRTGAGGRGAVLR